MDTPLMSIAYEFNAEAVVAQKASACHGSITPVKFERTIEVKRCLPESDLPHHSVRIFPPTNIKAGAHYTQVLYPTGRNTLSMRLDGLTTKRPIEKTIEYWKLKKVTWRLEENIRTIAPACAKHTPGGVVTAGAKKGVERVEKYVLGEESRTGGWKADYTSSSDGNVEFEFDFFCTPRRHGGARYAADSRSRDGTQVSHNLMVELVVSREWAPANRPEMCSQTGTGRILRMHYRVVITEQGGMSVSWDNECPPVYQDVPPSPPGYPDEGGPVDYESLEPLEAERSSVEGGIGLVL
jgi:arrestin-related trafficking adapter 1